MEKQYKITAFYFFKPLTEAEVEKLKSQLEQECSARGIKGLVVLGKEGINSTCSGTVEAIDWLEGFIKKELSESVIFKNSFADFQPFRRFKVDLRDEIVTIGDTEIIPVSASHNHLSPEEWHRTLNEEQCVLIDTRNDYETRIGKFQGALDPEIKSFSEFGDYVQNSGIPKDKKVLMYCTGGIRCEKAIYEMEKQGYDKVYQLQGGILNYFEKYPDGLFEGECFVFDHRVAVDSQLQPSKRYTLCPHCGDPADNWIDCSYCGSKGRVCQCCFESEHLKSCSKNCAHHIQRGTPSRI
jgi:UPF0176 protein